MTRPLKVYGYVTLNPYTREEVKGAQVRVVMAAHSVAEVLRATGDTRSTYNWSGYETGNDDEIQVAMSAPGVPFYRGLDSRKIWLEFPNRVDNSTVRP